MNEAFEVSDRMKYESCTHPQPNEIKCNVQYKLSRNRIKNFENNDYFYDWGMIEEIHIPGKNLTTYLKWMRVKNWNIFYGFLLDKSEITQIPPFESEWKNFTKINLHIDKGCCKRGGWEGGFSPAPSQFLADQLTKEVQIVYTLQMFPL